MSNSINARKITERIVVEGNLILLSPTSLGNGDSDGLTDMPLLKDEVEGNALLTGTSIAGALRNYLQEFERGFEVEEDKDSITRKLFGYHEDEYSQSYLIIDDALSDKKPTTELRDGVRIDSKTRTAKEKAKFDFELLEAGTKFKLCFEFLICEGQDTNSLISAFATALQGFEKGEIHIGARKRRGYGECEVKEWKVKKYELNKPTDLIDWLKNNGNDLAVTPQTEIVSVLQTSVIGDSRSYFALDAAFALDGSILIRSGSKFSDKYQPDDVHLRSKRNGIDEPILSGTSLAGVLRHRAVKICNTLKDDSGEKFVEKIFGVDMEKRNHTNATKETPFASRLEVKEKTIDRANVNSLVQTRVKIDRFTGGAMDTALFDAAPVFSDGNKKAVRISLKLRNPKESEIGLLLLLLKDLWTSDLAVGGESSIGRGRLKGKKAILKFKEKDEIVLEAETDKTIKPLAADRMERLNKFVEIFNQKINEEQSNGTGN